MIYYKATRPDGTDFYTGTINYAIERVSGSVVNHPTSTAMVPNDASTYLSVSTEPADCNGLSWPCRLFAVEPVGDTMTGLEASPSKVACHALRVTAELPAWQAFGPNGEAVVALFDRAARLTQDEAVRMDAAWVAAWDAARVAARVAAWVAAWDAARSAARVAARSAAWYAAWYGAWDAAWYGAWSAARSAAGALVVRDLITPEQFDLLAGPWLSVMGEMA